MAERSARAGLPVVVAAPFMYDATVRGELSRLHVGLGALSLVESVVRVPAEGAAQGPEASLSIGLFAQVAAIGLTMPPLRSIEVHREKANAYLATGVTGKTTVLLAGLLSSLPAPVLCVDLVALEDRWTIRLDETAIAAPALFVSCSGTGLYRPPVSYESGLRAAWRNLHAAVTGNEPVRYGLSDLVGDMALLAGVLDRHD